MDMGICHDDLMLIYAIYFLYLISPFSPMGMGMYAMYLLFSFTGPGVTERVLLGMR